MSVCGEQGIGYSNHLQSYYQIGILTISLTARQTLRQVGRQLGRQPDSKAGSQAVRLPGSKAASQMLGSQPAVQLGSQADI
jgi:hypothetical protein